MLFCRAAGMAVAGSLVYRPTGKTLGCDAFSESARKMSERRYVPGPHTGSASGR